VPRYRSLFERRLAMPEFPKIVFGSSDPAESRRIRVGLRLKMLRKLVPRAYTSWRLGPVEAVIAWNLYQLIDHLFPEAVISHRSAFSFPYPYPKWRELNRATAAIHVTYRYTERIEWPGVTVALRKGPSALDSDEWVDKLLYPRLRRSSRPRALLENMQPSRQTDRGAKTYAPKDIEDYLRWEGRRNGSKPLVQLQSEAEAVAGLLGMERELETFRTLIAAAVKESERPRYKTARLAKEMGVSVYWLRRRIRSENSLASKPRNS